MTEVKKETTAKAEAKHVEKKEPAKAEHVAKKAEHAAAKTEAKAAKPVEHKTDAKKADTKGVKKEKKEEKVNIVSENIYIIPLRQVYRTHPRYRRSSKAAKMIVKYLKRHTKSDDVRIDIKLNEHLWARGDHKPPRKVQVKAVKDSTGKVVASLVK